MNDKICEELLKKHNGNLQKVLYEYYGNDKKERIEEKVHFKIKKDIKDEDKFPGRMIILKSYGFDEKISRELLIKHNGNLFKVLSEYQDIMEPKSLKPIYSIKKKEIKQVKKVEIENDGENQEVNEKDFSNKLIILKSYGFDEKKSYELLHKNDGNLQKVLDEYFLVNKPKDFEISYSIKELKNKE